MRLDDLKGLEAARKEKGLSQGALSLRSGVPQSDISKYEAGKQSMSAAAAEKLARVVGSNAVTLRFANAAKRMRVAKAQGDAPGVLNAAKAAVKVLGDRELDADDESAVDELVDTAITFAEKSSGATATKSREPSGFFTGLAEEGRDAVGRKVSTKSAEQDGDFWLDYLAPEHRGPSFDPEIVEDDEDEIYDSMVGEGRDPITGQRIDPIESGEGW